MAFDLQSPRKQISILIRPIALCFAFGIGVGVAIVSTNAMIHYCQSRPKAWDRKSVRATLADAEPISEGDLVDDLGFVPVVRPDRSPVSPRSGNKSSDRNASAAQPLKIAETNTGVSFSVDLQNTTNKDVIIPKSVLIMQATRSTHALHSSLLGLDRDYFIPAGHSVTATLENSEFCAAGYDARRCFDDHFKEDDEIVLFDQNQKYEIHIVIPRIRIPQNQQTEQTGRPTPPTGH